MLPEPVIQTHALSKTYGSFEAVSSLDLAIKPGLITGFLGRNGAGKSSTLKMLLGIIQPTSGEASVLGTTILDAPALAATRRRVAYVSEDKRLYDYMTVGQLIAFTSSFYKDWRPEVAARLLDEYELPAGRGIKALSKGMRTKLALLLAFARRPELLILDEPSEGLDPVGIEHLLQCLLAAAAEGTTVFFSSHQIAEVERVAEQICMLDRGRLVLDSPMPDLRAHCREITVTLPSPETHPNWQLPGVLKVRRTGSTERVLTRGGEQAVIARANEAGALSVSTAHIGLREVFLALAEAERRAA